VEIRWLREKTRRGHEDEDGIVNILGRHKYQEGHFDFQPIHLLGAAKGCGHGNHDGPKQGKIHRRHVIGEIPVDEFLETFGVGGSPG
jgi:hypothetical protein